MNTLTAPEVIAAFVASILGGTIAAFFNEFLSDFFFNKKRKRAMKVELTKLIVQYFRQVILHVNSRNAFVIHRVRVLKLQEQKKKPNLTVENKANLVSDVRGMFEYIRDIQEKGSVIYNRVTEIESEIIALSIDSQNYFSVAQHRQLKKSLTEALKESSDDKVVVKGYEQLEYDKLIEYQNEEFHKSVTAINQKLDEKKNILIEQVNEILSK